MQRRPNLSLAKDSEMGRTATVLAYVALSLSLSGCMTGPSYLSRSVDDTMNNTYKESPIGAGVLTDVLPVYPLVKLLAWIPDVLILNPVQFWGFDIWREEGAAFRHKNPAGARDPWFK